MNILSFNSIEGLESIDFCLENCDVISVPLDNIKSESFIDYTPGDSESNHLSIHLIDDGNIVINSAYKNSPCQRLNMLEDIVGIDLIFDDGRTERVNFPWSDEEYCVNRYQTSELISYKEIKLSIERKNRNVDIYSALDLDDDTELELMDTGEIVILKTINGDKVIVNKETGELLTFSRSLLRKRFILIDNPSY